MILTDEKLIKTTLSGDDGAFKQLVVRYESRVAATVIGMLGNCPEAEDVGQESFIRFYKGLKDFRGNSSVATYLTRIAINLSLNELKRRKRRALLFPQKAAGEEENLPEQRQSNKYNEEKELIQFAVRKLGPKFRSVFVLRLIDGYSTAETAEILKLPVGTVLSRLARAQEKVRKILTPYWENK